MNSDSSSASQAFHLRPANNADIPALSTLISASVQTLHTPYYPPCVISLALQTIYIISPTLITDGSCFLVTTSSPSPMIVGCSAYTYRTKENLFLDPKTDVAILKALYVHPEWARKGVGRLLLRACEDGARERGFRKMEFAATFAGKEFYLREGYEVLRDGEGEELRDERDLGEGEKLVLVRMGKDLV